MWPFLTRRACQTQSECTFAGAWGGSQVPAVFYISSYFWDRAQDVGLIPDDKTISVVIKPAVFRTHGDRACKTPMQHLPTEFPAVRRHETLSPEWLPFMWLQSPNVESRPRVQDALTSLCLPCSLYHGSTAE